MSVLHESTAFPGIFGDNASVGKGKAYRLLRPEAVHNLRRILFRTPVPAMCRKLMMEILFRQGLVVVIDREVQSAEDTSTFFQELLVQYYEPALQKAFDEFMIMGLCIVQIVKSATGQHVPAVISSEGLGKVFELRIYMDTRTGDPFYQVYWLLDKQGKRLNKPKKAKHSFVFNSIFKGPTVEGELQSPLSALAWSEFHYEEMLECDRVANFNLSDPTVLTISANTDGGVASIDIGTPSYSQRDVLADLRGVYAHDQANAIHMEDQLKKQRTGREWFPTGRHLLHRHLDDNVKTLPMGTTVASGIPQPRLRADLMEQINLYYSKCAAVFGLDRRYIFPDGSNFKTSDSSTLLRDRMEMTQRFWSKCLSQVATKVAVHNYKKDQCNILFDHIQEVAPDIDFETLIKRVDVLTDIKIVLPISTATTLEEMQMMYSQGLLSWDEYFTQGRNQGGFLPRSVPPEPVREEEGATAGGGGSGESDPKKRKATDDGDNDKSAKPAAAKKQRTDKEEKDPKDKKESKGKKDSKDNKKDSKDNKKDSKGVEKKQNEGRGK